MLFLLASLVVATSINLCGLIGVVSHALADGGYWYIHVQGYACRADALNCAALQKF